MKIINCPYCGELLTENNTKSIEHIISESLGNTSLILLHGVICDKCNNYFVRKIENDFLNLEQIKKLRAFHFIPSKKEIIPSLSVLFCGNEAKFDFDVKNNCGYLGCSPETILKIYQGYKPEWILVNEIDVLELNDNYVISRFLLKIFTEMFIYYILEFHKDEEDELFFQFDKDMKEVFNYTRYGNLNKIYKYTLKIKNDINPFNTIEEYITIKFKGTNNQKITGMLLNLCNLEFELFL